MPSIAAVIRNTHKCLSPGARSGFARGSLMRTRSTPAPAAADSSTAVIHDHRTAPELNAIVIAVRAADHHGSEAVLDAVVKTADRRGLRASRSPGAVCGLAREGEMPRISRRVLAAVFAAADSSAAVTQSHRASPGVVPAAQVVKLYQ